MKSQMRCNATFVATRFGSLMEMEGIQNQINGKIRALIAKRRWPPSTNTPEILPYVVKFTIREIYSFGGEERCNERCFITLGITVLLLSMVLSACAQPAAPTEAPAPVATEAPAPTEAPPPTEAPAATEAPVATEAPTEASSGARLGSQVQPERPRLLLRRRVQVDRGRRSIHGQVHPVQH